MIVKAIYKDDNFDYFNDKVTNTKRYFGEVFECDDELAKERIAKKLVKEATKKEQKKYINLIDTVDSEDVVE